MLEGRVVDLRGEGVPLTKVWVATRQAPDQELARGVCDGEGYFRIGKVPRRTDLVACASAESRCRAQSSLSRGPVTLTLHDAAIVRGTLTNRAGEPVASAIVPPPACACGCATGTSPSGSVVEVITDRQGRCRFVGLSPGGAWLQLLVDEEHPTNRDVEPFAVEAGKTYTFALQVPSK
ncbi:MAG: carboxypeptidase-like regulatory domain-containing protein [Planctomycetota bacterium]